MYIIIKAYCEISFKPNCVWFQLMSFRDDLEILEQDVSSFLLVLYVQLSFQILTHGTDCNGLAAGGLQVSVFCQGNTELWRKLVIPENRIVCEENTAGHRLRGTNGRVVAGGAVQALRLRLGASHPVQGGGAARVVLIL